MGRLTGWDLCLGEDANRNAVYQDLSASYCEPQPSSLALTDPQWLSPQISPSDLHEVRPEWATLEAFHSAGRADCPLWVLFFH